MKLVLQQGQHLGIVIGQTHHTSAPWFIRSGIYSNTSGAGIFYFSYTAGAPNDGVGFRPVLLVGEGL